MNAAAVLDGDEITQVNVVHANLEEGRITNMTLKCSQEADPGHYLWLQTLYFNEGQIMLTAVTASACMTWSPTPMPVPKDEMCTLVYNDVVLNLVQYNNETEGWKATVKVTGDIEGQALLLYQPCDGIPCPEGGQCEGDDDATVWLCQGKECIGYGLFEHKLTAYGVDGEDSYVVVNYKGDRHREAVVDYVYDQTVETNTTLKLPGEVNVRGTRISFKVGTNKNFNVPPRHGRGRVGYGAVVLLAVAAIGTLYLGIGVIVGWVKSGTMAVPNAEFWDEVWLSLHTAIITICPCCSRGPQKVQQV
jgi:hypothetical protein